MHPVNGLAADKLGLIAQARHEDTVALRWFSRSNLAGAELAAGHYDLAGMLEQNGDIAGALREYELAVELQHNHAPAHLNYGVLLARRARYAEAAKQFEEAIRIDPSSTLARRDLAAALERSGQLDAAADQLHILLEKLPDDALLYQDLGFVEVARHNNGPRWRRSATRWRSIRNWRNRGRRWTYWSRTRRRTHDEKRGITVTWAARAARPCRCNSAR